MNSSYSIFVSGITRLQATSHINQVYNLAADMGGIGYITAKLADIAHNNILINAHMLEACRLNGIKRFLFSSSACVYAGYKQERRQRHSSAGRRRLSGRSRGRLRMGEAVYRAALQVLLARLTDWRRESCASITSTGRWERTKAAKRKLRPPYRAKWRLRRIGDPIEVWGDGLQTRSFMYITDCVEGLLRLMASDYREPLNLGTEEMVSVDQLVDLVCDIAGKKLIKRHDCNKPQGVRGRNSDNSRLRTVLGWEPQTPLRDWLDVTYHWIEDELRKAGRVEQAALAYASD